MTDEIEALLGHNQPPTLVTTSVGELDHKLEPLAERRDQFAKAMASVKVRTREEAGKAADVIKLATEFAAVVEERRVEVSRPLHDAHRAVVDRARTFLSPMERLLGDPSLPAGAGENADTIHGKINDWQAAEAKRVADQKREQAETEARLRAEADARAAPDDSEIRGEAGPGAEGDGEPMADRPQGRAKLEYGRPEVSAAVSDRPEGVVVEQGGARPQIIRGDYGGRIGARARITVEIEDLAKIPRSILESDVVTAAILKVAKARAQHEKEIPGIRINRGTTNQVY